MRVTAAKAELMLAADNEQRDAFIRLFRHMKEHAQLLSERPLVPQAIERWLAICDDYVTYGSQFPPLGQARWHDDYHDLAATALERAIGLAPQLKNPHQHLDLLIGLANFSLILNNDTERARQWMDTVNASKPALGHYALHIRNEYARVTHWLSSASSARARAHAG
jgi:hypothetical protein